MSNPKIANHKYIYEFKSLALKICIFSNFLCYKDNILYVKSQYFFMEIICQICNAPRQASKYIES